MPRQASIHVRLNLDRARLHLPQRVPVGVHACWLDTAKLETIAARATAGR